ncbi:hypothetical protein AVEN_207260-1 [Araneus ventricosus]|uniref:Secreted protein n=1 Tax=Araneus ventricosus TaxID=182803 RepID=A0A4Y2ELY8_ARAVE|nr:hypothetical protein AVEN_87168-1 [Araneus ventricosus]GBM30200.1 hypothetical protein AVEN_207260-1 [Araneus ventricosus]
MVVVLPLVASRCDTQNCARFLLSLLILYACVSRARDAEPLCFRVNAMLNKTAVVADKQPSINATSNNNRPIIPYRWATCAAGEIFGDVGEFCRSSALFLCGHFVI